MSVILRLYISEKWIESGGSEPVKWTVSGKGHQGSSSGVAAGLADIPACDHLEIVAPASAAFLTSLQTPGKNLRLFKRTLRFAVEDQIISDPESVHVAAGPVGPDQFMPVAVADRGWMRKTLGLLADNGIYPRAMIAEPLVLPIKNGNWSVGLSGLNGALRTGLFSGVPLDVAKDGSPPLILEMALDEARKNKAEPAGINIFLMNGSTPLDVESWEKRLNVPITVSGPQDDSATVGPKPAVLNLLQGEFAPAMRIGAMIPHLKIPAALLALALILHLSSYFVEFWLMKQESLRLAAETDGTFRKLFPDIASVTDPSSQMSFKLQQLKTLAGEDENSGELLALLGKTAPLIPATAKMRGLKYGPAGLELKLALQEEKDVKTFSDAVAGVGLDVSAKPGVKEEDGFLAEFLIAQKGKKK
jgi:general secretion pathway protein L